MPTSLAFTEWSTQDVNVFNRLINWNGAPNIGRTVPTDPPWYLAYVHSSVGDTFYVAGVPYDAVPLEVSFAYMDPYLELPFEFVEGLPLHSIPELGVQAYLARTVLVE